ncbi:MULTISPECIES: DNA polymerase III subunit beta [unclassified Paenibacillus]|uniref:DNA polymerase III subunit beta n=1 Tax=unclassified Paenibacillus TaxID=185978 RepID=UPI0012FD6002|nr:MULTISPECIES: DNA polymerase III subunit beta [unclassified Paenibacillus]ASS66441.2 hypothetical protein CIC07_09950 [Paenibacillus sp. RUD330]
MEACDQVVPAGGGFRSGELHLDAGAGELAVSSAAGRIAHQAVLPVDAGSLKIEHTGRLALPARYFLGVIRQADGEWLELEGPSGGMARIKAGQSEHRLAVAESGELPVLADAAGHPAFVLEAGSFHSRLKQVFFAAAASGSRLPLTGIRIEAEGPSWKLSATDGIRYASCRMGAWGDGGAGWSCLIPAKPLHDSLKTLGMEKGASLVLAILPSQVQLSAGRAKVQLPRLEGRLPFIKEDISGEGVQGISLDSAAFRQALDRACLIAGPSGAVRLSVDAESAFLSARTAGIGETRQRLLGVERTAGAEPAWQVLFHGGGMREIVHAIDFPRLSLAIGGRQKPIRITVPDDEGRLYMVAPILDAAQSSRGG